MQQTQRIVELKEADLKAKQDAIESLQENVRALKAEIANREKDIEGLK